MPGIRGVPSSGGQGAAQIFHQLQNQQQSSQPILKTNDKYGTGPYNSTLAQTGSGSIINKNRSNAAGYSPDPKANLTSSPKGTNAIQSKRVFIENTTEGIFTNKTNLPP